MNKKTWKVLGAGTLALFMGIGTLCGVLIAPANTAAQMQASEEAPSATQASSATNAETYGLVTPCEDDPVVYITQSGLEIKWGNALPNYNYSLGSGGMAGFPYFTTTKSGTTYTWVIIGRNPSITQTPTLYAQRFDGWKTDKSQKSTYYQNNHSTSPALTAINSSADTRAIVYDNIGISRVKSSSELSSYANGVLCLLNTPIGPVLWREDSTKAFGQSGHTATDTLKGYYNNDSFGFGSNKTNIYSVSVKQKSWYWDTNAKDDKLAPSPVSMRFFPLDFSTPRYYTSYPTSETHTETNFCYDTYLTKTQWVPPNNTTCWLRNSLRPVTTYMIDANGEPTYSVFTMSTEYSNNYLRPACVYKIS